MKTKNFTIFMRMKIQKTILREERKTERKFNIVAWWFLYFTIKILWLTSKLIEII